MSYLFSLNVFRFFILSVLKFHKWYLGPQKEGLWEPWDRGKPLGETQRLLFHNSDTSLLGLGLKDPEFSVQRTGGQLPDQLLWFSWKVGSAKGCPLLATHRYSLCNTPCSFKRSHHNRYFSAALLPPSAPCRLLALSMLCSPTQVSSSSPARSSGPSLVPLTLWIPGLSQDFLQSLFPPKPLPQRADLPNTSRLSATPHQPQFPKTTSSPEWMFH